MPLLPLCSSSYRYVDLSDLAQLTDPDKTGPDGEPVNAWESQDGASPQMVSYALPSLSLPYYRV